MFWVKTHASIKQYSKYNMRGTVKDPEIMICFSLRNRMFNSSVYTNGMDSLFLKNVIERIIAPSLKVIILALPISSLGISTEA